MKPFLETLRLELASFTLDDIDRLARLDGDPEVMRYIADGSTKTREQTREGIERTLRYCREHPGLGIWSVVERDSGAWTGWASLKHLVPPRLWNDPKYESWKDKIEVGYRLLREHWGKGIATVAARALLEYGFRTLGLERIHAIVHPRNAASVRVLEKLGMQKLGSADYGGFEVLHYQRNRDRSELS